MAAFAGSLWLKKISDARFFDRASLFLHPRGKKHGNANQFFVSRMKRTALLAYDDARLTEVNSDLFGALSAYQISGANGEPFDRYVLCYADTLVDIEFNWALTEEQMTRIGEKLNK